MWSAYTRPRRSCPSYQAPADVSAQTSSGMSAQEEKNRPMKVDAPMLLDAMALTCST